MIFAICIDQDRCNRKWCLIRDSLSAMTAIMLGKNFSRQHFEIFSQKIGFNILCISSILHKASKPFFWEKYFKMSSAENFTQRDK